MMHQGALATEEPPGSRLFIVCGRSVEEETLRAAFRPYGSVQNVKVIREKGVAYVKFDKASSAALAIESLNGAVLNNGRGPKLKVLLAEAPPPRGVPVPPKMMLAEEVLASDPDNHPPRSRLFVVVPKTADAAVLQEELGKYEDVEYVKTDLISPKGIVFCKHSKASSALRALEDICARGTLGPYKVKCMLAEPKTRRTRMDTASLLQQPGAKLDFMVNLDHAAAAAAAAGYRLAGAAFGAPGSATSAFTPQVGGYGFDTRGGSALAVQQAAALTGMGAAEYAALTGLAASSLGFAAASGVSGLHGSASAASIDSLGGSSVPLGGFGGLAGSLAPASTPDSGLGASNQLGAVGPSSAGAFGGGVGPPSSMGSGSSSLSTAAYPLGGYGGVGLSPNGASVAPGSAAGRGSPVPLSRQRLFVVVHKACGEDAVSRLFRAYPGMEYCDLKKDKATGRSKGYAYVNYSTPEAAAAAIADLHGIEFPAGSGYRLKVMPAEVMSGPGGGPSGGGALGLRSSVAGGAGSGRPPRSPAVVAPSALGGSSGPSPAHTPLPRNLGHEIAAVGDSLGAMSLPSGLGGDAGGAGTPHSSYHHHHHHHHHGALNGDATPSSLHHHSDVAPGSVIGSPVPSAVARELLFNVG